MVFDPETFRKPRRQTPRTRNEIGQEIDLETGKLAYEYYPQQRMIVVPSPLHVSSPNYGSRATEICERYLSKLSRIDFSSSFSLKKEKGNELK